MRTSVSLVDIYQLLIAVHPCYWVPVLLTFDPLVLYYVFPCAEVTLANGFKIAKFIPSGLVDLLTCGYFDTWCVFFNVAIS